MLVPGAAAVLAETCASPEYDLVEASPSDVLESRFGKGRVEGRTVSLFAFRQRAVPIENQGAERDGIRRRASAGSSAKWSNGIAAGRALSGMAR